MEILLMTAVNSSMEQWTVKNTHHTSSYSQSFLPDSRESLRLSESCSGHSTDQKM